MKNTIEKFKICLVLLALSLSSFVAACSDDEEAAAPEIVIPENIQQGGVSFSKAGGTQKFSVQSTMLVEAKSSDQTWCTVTVGATTETMMVTPIEVTVQPNTETKDRTATITITGGGLTEEVKVTQTAQEGLDIETMDFENIPAEGGTVQVKLTTNGNVKVTINDSWITESPETRADMADATKTFAVAVNRGAARKGTITFTLGDISSTVTIKQLAGNSGEIETGNAWEVAKALGMGWNLGNQLDAHLSGVANETAWGNQKTTQALFDKLAGAGITSVRIPVTWMGHVSGAPAYIIETEWMDRVAEVVGYAEKAGLKAIINMHHDGADSNYWLDIKNAATNPSVNAEVRAQLKSMWAQIAERFKDKGSFLIFESMNEIHDGDWGWGANRTDGGKQYAVLNEWNQLFVDVVRSVGGENSNRYLGIPSYCANPDYAIDGSLKLPTDEVPNRLMVSVHYYAPTDYSLSAKFSEWGHTAAADKKDSWGDEPYVIETFEKLKKTFIDKNIPVYIGEMGCARRADSRAESFRKYYLEYICKAAKTYGLAPFYWDNGSSADGAESSGLFNHATGAYLNNAQDIVETMTKAVFTEDASYTLQTVYDSAPQ